MDADDRCRAKVQATMNMVVVLMSLRVKSHTNCASMMRCSQGMHGGYARCQWLCSL